MMYGEDIIVTCPRCGQREMYQDIISGNTLGATAFTDGYLRAPMLEKVPPVVKCNRCSGCYWLEESGEGTPFWKRLLARFQNSGPPLRVQEPDETAYYKALKEGLGAKFGRERTLRLLAWRRRNDAFRDLPEGTVCEGVALSGQSRESLSALVGLLDESNHHEILLKAEALRELGEFDSARQALERIPSEEYGEIIDRLRSLCDAGDVCVRAVDLSG